MIPTGDSDTASAALPLDEEGRLYHLGLSKGERTHRCYYSLIIIIIIIY